LRKRNFIWKDPSIDLFFFAEDNDFMRDDTTDPILKSLDSSYRQGQFDTFQGILIKNKSKFDPKLFHYNLGLSYLQKSNYPAARLHIEKSLHIGNSGRDILKAKQLVLSGIESVAQEEVTFQDWWHYRALEFSPLFYLNLSLLFGILLLILIKLKKLKSKVFLVFLGTLLFFPLGFSEFYVKKLRFAITLQESSVRVGPSRIYKIDSSLPAGTKVIIVKRKGDWFFLKTPEKYQGWVKNEDVGVL
jgi:hypothetical protein